MDAKTLKKQPNQKLAELAYFQREAKRRSIAGETNRPMAYDDINEKVRNIDFNNRINPDGTLNLDYLNNRNFEKVKGPEGIYINALSQSKENQKKEHFGIEIDTNHLVNNIKHSSTVLDIAKGMRMALGISEAPPIPLDRKATRQLTRVTSLNRPIANKRWSKEEIQALGVYKM